MSSHVLNKPALVYSFSIDFNKDDNLISEEWFKMPDNCISHTCSVTEDLSTQRLLEISVFVIEPLCK